MPNLLWTPGPWTAVIDAGEELAIVRSGTIDIADVCRATLPRRAWTAELLKVKP